MYSKASCIQTFAATTTTFISSLVQSNFSDPCSTIHDSLETGVNLTISNSATEANAMLSKAGGMRLPARASSRSFFA